MLKKGEAEYLANLAKIAVNAQDIEKMEKDMASIIALMDSIHDVSLENAGTKPKAVTISSLREDKAEMHIEPERLLAGSPDGSGDSFTIPKLMEQ